VKSIKDVAQMRKVIANVETFAKMFFVVEMPFVMFAVIHQFANVQITTLETH